MGSEVILGGSKFRFHHLVVKLLKLHVLQFPHLQNGDINRIYLVEQLWGLNEIIHLKRLEECSAYGRHLTIYISIMLVNITAHP